MPKDALANKCTPKLVQQIEHITHLIAESKPARVRGMDTTGMLPRQVIKLLTNVTIKTLKKWRDEGVGYEDENLTVEAHVANVHGKITKRDFAVAWDELELVMGRKLTKAAFDIADDRDNPQQLSSIKMLLPRVDPDTWGPQATKAEVDVRVEARCTETYKIPQAVFDEMTEEESAQADKWLAMIDEGTAGLDDQVKAIQKRLGL